MNQRTLVIQYVTERMVEVYTKGDLLDAQNMNAYLAQLEQMSDEEYTTMAAEAEAQLT